MRFADAIDRVLAGEDVEAIVVGEHCHWDGNKPTGSCVVETWADARRFLDYDYDPDYGGGGCHGFWLWTATRILFVSEYDSSVHIRSLPRNPVDGKPVQI